MVLAEIPLAGLLLVGCIIGVAVIFLVTTRKKGGGR